MARKTETDRELSLVTRPIPVVKLLFCGEVLRSIRQWAITSKPLTLGREVDPDHGVPLSEDGKASAKHARLRSSAAGIQIEDLNSKNGTFINGKPLSNDQLSDGDVIRVGNSLLLLRHELPTPCDASSSARVVHELFRGTSAAVRSLRHTLERAAPQEAPVLLLGQTGTGKELAAQALHALSGKRGPLVRVNSSAIASSLAESTLFGHTDGAFTGAKRHTGYFREADSGTLMLDEIGDLSLDLQPKLLRALEERAIWPVGARRPEACQTRFIAATNRDLRHEVQLGRFRSDLYARLAALPISLPALRVRTEDILTLFIERLRLPDRQLTGRLCEALLLYPWPENVRELINLTDYARTFAAESGALDLPVVAERLMPPATIASEPAAVASDDREARNTRRRGPYTQEVLTRLMEENHGVLARVAAKLGLSRRQLSRILQKLSISPQYYRRGGE